MEMTKIISCPKRRSAKPSPMLPRAKAMPPPSIHQFGAVVST